MGIPKYKNNIFKSGDNLKYCGMAGKKNNNEKIDLILFLLYNFV